MINFWDASNERFSTLFTQSQQSNERTILKEDFVCLFYAFSHELKLEKDDEEGKPLTRPFNESMGEATACMSV